MNLEGLQGRQARQNSATQLRAKQNRGQGALAHVKHKNNQPSLEDGCVLKYAQTHFKRCTYYTSGLPPFIITGICHMQNIAVLKRQT